MKKERKKERKRKRASVDDDTVGGAILEDLRAIFKRNVLVSEDDT